MKFSNLKDLAEAAQNGEFMGTIFVDNDSVYAYEGDSDEADPDSDCSVVVFDFDRDGPEDVLITALTILGLNAERI